MIKNKKMILPIILTSLVTLTACSTKEEQKTNTTTNSANTTTQKTETTTAFDFTAKDIDGNDVKLSDFRGKKIYINVWASWCGPCIKEIPELEKVYQEFKNKEDFVFLSITSPSDASFKNLNASDESKKTILAKAEELGVTYPVLFDYEDKFLKNYSIRAFPTHIFINSDGTILANVPGMFNETTLKSYLEQLK